MSHLEVAEWVFRFLQVFGAACLLFGAFKAVSDWYQDRVSYVKRLESYNTQAHSHNEQLRALVEHGRTRELELTEERNRLRDRNSLMAKVISEDDICSERKKTHVMKR